MGQQCLQLEKNLNDDYVKFFGLVQGMLQKQSLGIVGLITNHAFFDNPTFRGFRWNLLSTFSRLRLLDLHGNSKKKEQAPDRLNNENIFDIQQGVGISILTRRPSQAVLGHVTLAEQWGTREEKYRALESGHFRYSPIECSPPWFRMSVQESDLAAEFNSYFSLAEAMPLNSTGIKTHRDAFVIDFDEQPLRERIAKFRGNAADESIADEFGLSDTYGWKLTEARRRIRARPDWQDAFQLFLYRPFDLRHIYYHGDLVELPRAECMQHLAGGNNLALLATRQITSPPFNHVTVTRLVSEMKTCSHDRGTNCFPLYLREDTSAFQFGKEQRLNFSPGFLRALSSALDIAGTQANDVPDNVDPEDIVHYAYAVFHSPGYRSRYAEFLKTEFPRLPLTGSFELFRALVRLGGELAALHLLESTALEKSRAKFLGKNRVVSKVGWTPADGGTVWIDGKGAKGNYQPGTSGFSPVPEEVWSFHIGGYQVCEKWLKDRGPKKGNPGRTLTDDDIEHYTKIVTSLSETNGLMQEIDEVIEQHGGWPGAFQAGEAETTPAQVIPFRPHTVEATPEERYVTCVPLVPLKAAAGAFSDPQHIEEDRFEWVVVESSHRLRKGMFVAQVVGKSMEPAIPDGAWCLFRAPVEGTRQGKTVLVQLRDASDPETGQRYTVKRYESDKVRDGDTWRHAQITLKPANPDFDPIVLSSEDEDELEVVAELVEVLRGGS